VSVTTKGIILAGGSGTRLYPTTRGISKQLLPIYNKPMIYYPITTLMKAGIKEILIISTYRDLPNFMELIGTGSQWGIHIDFIEQETPRGLAEAFILGEDFIGQNDCCLVLGDNVFHGHMEEHLQSWQRDPTGALIFAYQVRNPEAYGVIEFYENGSPLRIVEKPKVAKSPYAVTGLYFYDNQVIKLAKESSPSDRGELEITEINNCYLRSNELKVEILGRDVAWLDTGTYETLMQASQYVEAIENRTGRMVGCPEEIAQEMGFITSEDLTNIGKTLYETNYGKYLVELGMSLCN